jgi:hypothetical protein
VYYRGDGGGWVDEWDVEECELEDGGLDLFGVDCYTADCGYYCGLFVGDYY